MFQRELKAVVVGTDRWLELVRLEQGYVSSVLSSNIESDDQYILRSPELVKTKVVKTTPLSNCIALYIESDDRVFILHVSPCQAQGKKEWISSHRVFVEPYSQLRGKLKGKINVQVFGHVDNFNAEIFKSAIDPKVEVDGLMIVPPKTYGLLIATFNFERNIVEIGEEATPDDIHPKKKVWNLQKRMEVTPSASLLAVKVMQSQGVFKQELPKLPKAKNDKNYCCVIL